MVAHWNFQKWVRIFPPFSSAFLPFTLGSVYRGSSSDTEISVKKSWTFFPFSSAFLPFTLGSVYRGSSSHTEISVKGVGNFLPFFCFLTYRQHLWRVVAPHLNFCEMSWKFFSFSFCFLPLSPGSVYGGSWFRTEISVNCIQIFSPVSSAFLPFTPGCVPGRSSSHPEISVKWVRFLSPFFCFLIFYPRQCPWRVVVPHWNCRKMSRKFF